MELHQISLDKTVNFAIHHTVNIRRLKARPMILDTPIVEDITANLASPLYFLLACLYFCLLGLALFLSPVIQLALQ